MHPFLRREVVPEWDEDVAGRQQRSEMGGYINGFIGRLQRSRFVCGDDGLEAGSQNVEVGASPVDSTLGSIRRRSIATAASCRRFAKST